MHPTRCSEFQENDDQLHYNQLLQLAQEGMVDGSVRAIGECGLDYDRLEFCSKDIQKKYFQLQFQLAKETNLPMFLHNRNTQGDFYSMVRENRHMFKHGVVHSFTGSSEEAQALLDLDLFIGINGCSLKTLENIQVAKSIPLDRLMLETDAPWCDIRATHASFEHVATKFPSKKAEKFQLGMTVKSRNEPCSMIQVLEVMAAVHGMDPQDLATTVYENTQNIFF